MTSASQPDAFDTAVQLFSSTDMDREELDELVSELGRRLGLHEAKLDSSGTLALGIDDDVEMALGYQPGVAALIASVSLPCEGPGREGLLRHLLQANGSSRPTQGGVFAMAPGDKTLMLARRISLADRDVDRIANDLADFAELACDWLREIELYLDLFEEREDAEESADNATSLGNPYVRV